MEDSTIELVGQVFAYSGVGLAILVAGFFVIDALTPGKLGQQLMDGNPNASVLVAATMASLGLVLWFAIFFTGAGWDGLDECLIFGVVGVALQGIGFLILDLITPGQARTGADAEHLPPRHHGVRRAAVRLGADRQRAP